MGSSGLQEQNKWPTRDSLDPPWPPKLEPKFVKNQHVGAPEGRFVDQSCILGSIFDGSCFRPVFLRFGDRTSSDFGRVEPLKSDDTIVFLNVFFIFHEIKKCIDFGSIL